MNSSSSIVRTGKHFYLPSDFSPTSLPEKTLCEKWDETELIATTETEKQKLAELLKLNLEPTITDEE
jgi:hypothetical protein